MVCGLGARQKAEDMRAGVRVCSVFFFKQRSAYEIASCLVGSEMYIRDMASLERERDAIQRERLQALVHAAKRRAAPADTTPVQAAEYPALLKEVYRRADMPKPRNLVGMAKDLPVPEMEALLLAHLPAATEDEATELATQRGQAVKAYLAEQKLPEERLFIAAPKAAKPDEKWTPQAQLNLVYDIDLRAHERRGKLVCSFMLENNK